MHKNLIKIYQIRTNLFTVEVLLKKTEGMIIILNKRLHISFITFDSIMSLLNKVDEGLILNPNGL